MSNKYSLFLLAILFILATGCSKSEKSNSSDTVSSQEASVFGEISSSSEGDTIITLDLGNIPFGKTKDGVVSLKQNIIQNLIPSGLNESGKLFFTEESDSNLSIVTQYGCSSMKKTTGVCSVKIRATGKDLEEGELLSGQIIVHSDDETSTIINVLATHGVNQEEELSVLVKSFSNNLNFGTLLFTDKPKDLILNLKALRNIQSTESLEVIISEPFIVVQDYCSHKDIIKNNGCTIKIRLDPRLANQNIIMENKNISFGGVIIPLQGEISGYQPPSSQLRWTYENQDVNLIDFGELLPENIPKKFLIALKNKGEIESEELNVNVSSSGFQVINRCVNKVIAPNEQCSLEVRPDSSVGLKNLSLTVDILPEMSFPVTMNLVLESFVAIENTPNCGTLGLSFCDGTQNISRTYLCERYEGSVKDNSYVSNPTDCILSDMSPIICQSPAGIKEVVRDNGKNIHNCGAGQSIADVEAVVSCNEGFHYNESENSCDPNIIACFGDRATGTQTWNGTSYDSCDYNLCDQGYHLDEQNNSCVSVRSCKELLTLRPDYQNQDGTYYIDLDGENEVYSPSLVLCDMTTDGGGWTNIANNTAGYENVFSTPASLPSFGLVATSDATSIMSGSLTSIYSGSNCNTANRYLYMKREFYTLMNPTAVKYNLKSYASPGGSICGGALYGANWTSSILARISPTSFDIGALAICSNPPATSFRNFTSSQDYHFTTQISLPVNGADPVVFSVYANCAPGTNYYQLHSLMFR